MPDNTIGNGDQYFGWAGLTPQILNVPISLTHVPQWVMWKATPKPGGGQNKIPYQPDKRNASSTDPKTWSEFHDVVSAYEESPEFFSGLGFVITDRDDFIGGDLDHCRDAATGELTEKAQLIVDSIDTYWEVSPSGTGIRFMGRGAEGLRSFKGAGIEVYTGGRYLTITGHSIGKSEEPKPIGRQYIERLRGLARGETAQAPSQVTSPRDDEIVLALKESGLYQRDLGNGRHRVTCPLWHEHTGDDITGTVYMEANHGGFSQASFVCQHTHGDSMNLDWLRNHLGLLSNAQVAVEEIKADPLAWTKKYEVSEEAMEKISDPKWAYENLLIDTHVTAICSPPNGGKTTILLQIAAEMARDGYNVVYVNADVNPADAKAMYGMAKDHGFHMIFPDLAEGNLSMTDVVKDLEILAASGADLNNRVFIYDTLKKMTEVISKGDSKGLYKTFRRLSGMGLTQCALAHTNKYKDAEGKLIYEGTGDLRADVDELIYLEPSKNDGDKTMLVSTRADKVRGTFEPITFHISADRRVSRVGYIDVGEEAKRSKQYAKDRPFIEAILDVLSCGDAMNQSQVVKACHDSYGSAPKQTIRVLHSYCSSECARHHWDKQTGFAKNAIKFTKIKGRVISEDYTTVSGGLDS